MPVALGGHQDGQENHEARLQRLRQEISYWRDRAGRLAGELDELTPARAAALGPVVVRRLHVDHDTALHLADEADAQLARLTDDHTGPDDSGDDVDDPGLF